MSKVVECYLCKAKITPSKVVIVCKDCVDFRYKVDASLPPIGSRLCENCKHWSQHIYGRKRSWRGTCHEDRDNSADIEFHRSCRKWSFNKGKLPFIPSFEYG